ncbi:MAG: alpha-L-rhamnosidase [Gammaproteobacteria bacterium]|jgi:alpha-L-rhamnosidase|nr:alpha-L-rhamnosidase [Gammaproteobacteria bacterium]
MNSFNHYAYGAVGDWMYEVLGGINIDPAFPGYKHILIQPQPGGGFAHVSTSHMTPYGRVSSDWKVSGGKLQFVVVVPPNTTATIRLPDSQITAVSESDRPLATGTGITGVRQDGASTVVETGSGRYAFSYPYNMRAGERSHGAGT